MRQVAESLVLFTLRIPIGMGRAKRSSLLLTIIMSNEWPSDHNCIRKIAGSFLGMLSSLHLLRAPTPSSIDMDSSSDNGTK